VMAMLTMKNDFESGTKLHSTAGLVLNVVPVIHRRCLK
jgi:hypothetical protein